MQGIIITAESYQMRHKSWELILRIKIGLLSVFESFFMSSLQSPKSHKAM